VNARIEFSARQCGPSIRSVHKPSKNARRSLGKVSPQDFAEDAALRALTCHGCEDAWVVGDLGFAARTADGGETWETLDLGVDLRGRGDAHPQRSPGTSAARRGRPRRSAPRRRRQRRRRPRARRRFETDRSGADALGHVHLEPTRGDRTRPPKIVGRPGGPASEYSAPRSISRIEPLNRSCVDGERLFGVDREILADLRGGG